MRKYYKYTMTITTTENDSYPFDGYFVDHFEADKFLTENELEGNSIIIHSITEVEMDSLPNL